MDRVLLALEAFGYTDFARVGSLRRIAKPLLPYVANGRHSEGAPSSLSPTKGIADRRRIVDVYMRQGCLFTDVKELQEMLKAGDLTKEDEGYDRMANVCSCGARLTKIVVACRGAAPRRHVRKSLDLMRKRESVSVIQKAAVVGTMCDKSPRKSLVAVA